MIKKKSLLMAGLIAMGTLICPLSVLATEQETTAEVEVKPGTLTVSAPENVEMQPYTIERIKRRTKETSPSVIEIKDYRGSSSEGWILTAVASVPENTDILVALSPNLLSNKTIASVLPAYQSIMSSSSAVSISNENIATAEQVTQFNPTIEFWIPATIKVGTYTAQITWNLITAPSN